MLDWDQLQAEVVDHVSNLCRDQFMRTPPRRVSGCSRFLIFPHSNALAPEIVFHAPCFHAEPPKDPS